MNIKNILFTLLVIVLPVQNIYSQQNNIRPKEINDFWDDVDKHWLYESEKEFTKDEVMAAAFKLYKAIKSNPKEFYRALGERNEKIWEEFNKTGNRKLSTAGVHLGNVNRLITKYFGEQLTKAIMTPYFFRFKVLNITDTLYYSTVEKQEFFCRKITGIVEDVIKGDNTLKVGGIVDLVYLPMWIEEEGPIQIQENTSYFVGATVNDRISQMLISMPNEISLGLYPIINDTVQIQDDYWQVGKNTTWDILKSSFISKYVLEATK